MKQTALTGKWHQLKGTVVEQLGKLIGDLKLQQSGEATRVRGRIETAASSTDLNKVKSHVEKKPILN